MADVRGSLGDPPLDDPLEGTVEPGSDDDVIDGEFIDVYVMGSFQDGMWRATKMALEDLCAIGGRALWRKLK